MRTKIGNKIYTTCRDCDGNATRPFRVLGMPFEKVRVKCKTCGGRGKIEVKAEEVMKK